MLEKIFTTFALQVKVMDELGSNFDMCQLHYCSLDTMKNKQKKKFFAYSYYAKVFN